LPAVRRCLARRIAVCPAPVQAAAAGERHGTIKKIAGVAEKSEIMRIFVCVKGSFRPTADKD